MEVKIRSSMSVLREGRVDAHFDLPDARDLLERLTRAIEELELEDLEERRAVCR